MTDNDHTSNLLPLCKSILIEAEEFLHDNKLHFARDDYRLTVETALQDFSQQAILAKICEQHLEAVRYALAAFWDELVMYSAWSGRSAWLNNTLQWQLFNEHHAGEQFFSRLMQLRQSYQKNRHVIEIYYLCLQLGFQGEYRFKETNSLVSLCREIRQELTSMHEVSAHTLLIESERKIETKKKRLPSCLFELGIVAMFIITYFIYIASYNFHANKYLNDMLVDLNTVHSILQIFGKHFSFTQSNPLDGLLIAHPCCISAVARVMTL